MNSWERVQLVLTRDKIGSWYIFWKTDLGPNGPNGRLSAQRSNCQNPPFPTNKLFSESMSSSQKTLICRSLCHWPTRDVFSHDCHCFLRFSVVFARHLDQRGMNSKRFSIFLISLVTVVFIGYVTIAGFRITHNISF